MFSAIRSNRNDRRRASLGLATAAFVAASVWLLMAAAPAFAGDYDYWYALPTARVLRSDRPPATAQRASNANSAPAALTVSAAQAEYEGRQIVIRPLGRIDDLVFEPSDLVRVDDPAPTNAPAFIAAGNISVDRVFYVRITKPSWDVRSKKGWYPDALPPVKLLSGKAVPQIAYAGLTQPYYVLFHVPDGTPKGTYTGTLTLRADAGTPVLTIPISLRVYGFSVARRSLKTSFGLNMRTIKHWTGAKYAGADAWPAADPEKPYIESRNNGCDTMARQVSFMGDHRLTPQTISPAFGKPAHLDYETGPPTRRIFPGGWLTRQDFLDDFMGTGPASSYAGDRAGFSNITVPDGTYRSSAVNNPFSSKSARSSAITYFNWMRGSVGSANASKLIVYSIDEPHGYQRSFITNYGAFVHRYLPGARFLVTIDPVQFAFKPIKNVDIYVQKLHFWYRDYRKWVAPLRKAHKKVWFYSHSTSHQRYTPLYLIDKPVTDSRVIPWFAYLNQSDGILYFNVARWLSPARKSTKFRDPYADPLSGYNLVTHMAGNGDGSMTYPGWYPGYVPGTQYSSAGLGWQPALGLTVPGAAMASSLRMEALRDGLEDYEYLKVLEAKKVSQGYSSSQARAYALRFVARLINTRKMRDNFPYYTSSPAAFSSVRDAIAQEIER
jgi:hypothetical protein